MFGTTQGEDTKILGITRMCLRYVGLGSEQTILFARLCVPRAALRASIIMSQIIPALAYMSIMMSDWAVGLYAILLPLHFFVMVVAKNLIYVVLLIRTDRIAESIAFLQDVVDMRKS